MLETSEDKIVRTRTPGIPRAREEGRKKLPAHGQRTRQKIVTSPLYWSRVATSNRVEAFKPRTGRGTRRFGIPPHGRAAAYGKRQAATECYGQMPSRHHPGKQRRERKARPTREPIMASGSRRMIGGARHGCPSADKAPKILRNGRRGALSPKSTLPWNSQWSYMPTLFASSPKQASRYLLQGHVGFVRLTAVSML